MVQEKVINGVLYYRIPETTSWATYTVNELTHKIEELSRELFKARYQIRDLISEKDS